MNRIARTYRDVAKVQQRDQLVLEHLDYVGQICATLARQLPDMVDVANLQAAGVVGLIEAAQRFDEARGVAFKTFSYPRIRGAIIDELRRNSPLSQRVLEAVGRVRQAIEQMDPPVTAEALALQTGMTVEEIEECLAAMRVASPQTCDEASLSGSHESPAANIELDEQKQVLADAIEELPERERQVVQMYYLEELRLKEIGVVLGVSESRISRILSRAELKLRQAVQRRGL